MYDVIDIDDLTASEIEDLYALAADVKEHPDDYGDSLANRTLLMFFAKPSTRT
ncbi:MAG: ornithine carbamoyltransferase, partial [Halanaeroarchaeum sp.]